MKTNKIMTALHRFPRDRQIGGLSSDAMMRHVIYATVPGIVILTVILGIGVWIQLGLALVTAFCCEGLNALLRHKPLTRLDIYSGFVTAVLLAISVPATAPWWLIVTGTAFGLLLGKHVFGGMGMNIFNPAIVGFCAVYLSFSAEMSLYPSGYLSISDSFTFIFNTPLANDGLTGATELSSLKANGTFEAASQNYWLINLGWLIGGLYLWLRDIADWRLSLTFFGVFTILTAIFTSFSPLSLSVTQHLGLGSLIFTACFIITDPTSAATGRLGRIIYASLAAIFAVIIRHYSNMPDSMAFAVLLANLCAPMIDTYTRPQYNRGKV